MNSHSDVRERPNSLCPAHLIHRCRVTNEIASRVMARTSHSTDYFFTHSRLPWELYSQFVWHPIGALGRRSQLTQDGCTARLANQMDAWPRASIPGICLASLLLTDEGQTMDNRQLLLC